MFSCIWSQSWYTVAVSIPPLDVKWVRYFVQQINSALLWQASGEAQWCASLMHGVVWDPAIWPAVPNDLLVSDDCQVEVAVSRETTSALLAITLPACIMMIMSHKNTSLAIVQAKNVLLSFKIVKHPPVFIKTLKTVHRKLSFRMSSYFEAWRCFVQ